MIENCLRHKIIRDFLKLYTENRWKDLIPSLIEIGILNLQKYFNKLIFTKEELKNFSRHLQVSQIEKDKEKNREKENKEILRDRDIIKENKEYFSTKNNSREKDLDKEEINKLYKSQSKQNDTPKNYEVGSSYNNINIENNNLRRMKIIDLVSNNQEKQEKIKSCTEAIIEMKNNIKNNYHYFKNNISIDFKNKLTKQRGEYYKKINIEKNKNIQKNNINKISYAISYDKDLRPASISKKINNNQNTTNNIIAKKDDEMIKHNYSSERKSKNNSKSKNKKNKNKEKYMNINLNNLNRINNMQNVKRKHYNNANLKNKQGILHSGANNKNNFYKKLNVVQTHNFTSNEINNNYHIIKVDKPKFNKIKPKKNLNTNISSSYNSNYRNMNFINTLYQKVNTNGQAIKINNDNYFSNRDELNEFIRKNRIKLNIKQDINNRKNITKSEKPLDRKNNFLNMEEINNPKNNPQKNFDKKDSDNEVINREEMDKKNNLIKSFPNNIDIMNLNNIDSKTPKKNTIDNSEKETLSNKKNKITELKEIYEKNNKNEIKIEKNKENEENKENKENKENQHNEDNKNAVLKKIKIYDLNKDKNTKNNGFEKGDGKNGDFRYFNVFGYEGEDISLTQIEKDCSGMIDSSTSNEIQMNPDYFFKEAPKNVFKIDKSNDQSVNSNNNEA